MSLPNNLPDLSQMITFTQLYSDKKKDYAKLQSNFKKLQKKFDKLQKEHNVLLARVNSKPVKKAQKNIGVQVCLKQKSTEKISKETQTTIDKKCFAFASTQTTAQGVFNVVSIGVQTIVQDTVATSTQTDDQNNATSTQTMRSNVPESMPSDQYTTDKNIVLSKRNTFKCDQCEYTTTHRGHFSVHKAGGCKHVVAEKNLNCPICCQSYTYNNLRSHLRQYLIDSSKAQNGHQFYKPSDHQNLLQKIKKEKKELKRIVN